MPINLSDFTSDAGLSANVVPITAIPTITSTHVQGAIEELQLDIASIPAALTPKGTWNALTNTPNLASGTGSIGHFYVIDVAGVTLLDGVSLWGVGDNVFFGDDNKWHKVSNNSDVTTVFGRLGNIVAQVGDYTASLITNASFGNISATNVQAALNELDAEKQPTLVPGSNIKTLNGMSLLGSGDIITPTTTVNNTLTSTSTIEALSANQGKVLQDSKVNKPVGSTQGFIATVDSTGNNVEYIAAAPTATPNTQAEVTTGTAILNKYVQPDTLKVELDKKLIKNTAITGATKTKITYDANGLVISGTDITAIDVVNTPSGNLLATTVQGALDELQTELDSKVIPLVIDNLTSNSITDSLSANQGKVLSDADIASGTITGTNLVLTLKSGSNINVDVTSLLADVKLTSGVYNPTTKALDLTLSDTTLISIPVSSLLPVTHDLTLSGDGATTPLSVPLSTDAGQTLSIGSDGKLLSIATPTQIATVLETETGTDNTKALSPADGEATYIKKSVINAKGDLIVGTADNISTVLPVGTNNQVLVSDPTTATGLKWGTPAVGIVTGLSLTGDGTATTPTTLDNDLETPGNYKVYGTSSTGTKGWQSTAVTVTVGQIQAFATTTIPQGYKLLNGQTLVNGVALYPILAGMYSSWVVGADIVLPNLMGVSADGGYFLRSASSTRLVNTFQADGFKAHNHQNGDITANNGDNVLAQRSASGSNTATTSDASAGELNILNSMTMIPMEGGTETRPINYTVVYAVATDEVIQPMADTINVTVTPAINPVKTWSSNTLYTVGDIVYNAPFLYRVDTGFTSGATFSSTNMTTISPRNKVYVQSGIPTVVPIATAIEGDHCIVTSDGTTSGVTQSSWVYNGTNWVLMYTQSTALTTTNTIRTYYPSTTAYHERWTTLQMTASSIAAYGFTAVGGATIIPYAAGALWNGYAMIEFNNTLPTQATIFNVPTSYIRSEVAIEPGFDNTYFIQTINEVARDPKFELWICNPITGIPLTNGRIYATTTSAYDVNANSQTYQRSPKNSSGIPDAYREWFAWVIPKALIDANKTVSNTIKLALRKTVGSGGSSGYISGFAVAKTVNTYIAVPYLSYGWAINETTISTVNNGNTPTNWAVSFGIYSGYIVNNQTTTLKVPVSDVTKDIYLTIMGMERDADGLDYTCNMSDFTLVHTSGDVVLGRPNPDIYAPSSNIVRSGFRPMGFIIPATTLAAKVTTPTGSAISYLSLKIFVPLPTTQNAHFGAIITEYV